MNSSKTIGIVGGVGPYAGLDLAKKVFDQTIAKTDQEHLNVVLLSWPSLVPDRTAFLLGSSEEDPSVGIAHCLRALESAGADVAGIACNTAHSPRLLDNVTAQLTTDGSRLVLINMIESVADFIATHHPSARRIGILATNGTVASNVYGAVLEQAGLEVVYPEKNIQHSRVHAAIYDSDYGIKAHSVPVTEHARTDILISARHLLSDRSVDAIVLGCTELPLAVPERQFDGRPLIDASLILARALVAAADSSKLKPWRD
ncbi:MAG: amino acid racemase [Gammaproteobacteria bacterium]